MHTWLFKENYVCAICCGFPGLCKVEIMQTEFIRSLIHSGGPAPPAFQSCTIRHNEIWKYCNKGKNSHTSTAPQSCHSQVKGVRRFSGPRGIQAVPVFREWKGGISVKQPCFFLLLQRSLPTNTDATIFWTTEWLFRGWRARQYSHTCEWTSTSLKIFR